MSNNHFRPDETLQKMLISTTSRFSGEYEGDSLFLGHSWPDFSSNRQSLHSIESPLSRNAFICVFRTKGVEIKLGTILPDYSYVGNIICSYLAVLYGKRFDFHGFIEQNGFYSLPDLSHNNQICNNKLPINSYDERKCFPVPLNLTCFSVFENVLTNGVIDSKFISLLNTCCKFYLQALQISETDPELAYLHLITAGEVLSSFYKFKNEELLDPNIISYLDIIRAKLDDGDKIANQITCNMRSIKRKFIKTISSLIDDQFFDSVEPPKLSINFKKESFIHNISAAYDLRSKYVHTGISFGRWIKSNNNYADLSIGKPVINDSDLSKILCNAPLFSGLERIIRYCLIKFMDGNGIEISKTIRAKKHS
jgi:hypothetical protein